MRVGHILRKYVPAEWGGTETALQRLTAGLAAHDVKSVVYAPAVPNVAWAADDPLAATGCELRQFRACVPVWGLAPDTRQKMLAIGGNLMSFDLPGQLSRDTGLDVIHSHVLGRIGGIASTIARRRNLPFVLSIHGGALDLPVAVRNDLSRPGTKKGLEWGRLFGWWWRARHVLAEADAILTCNEREAGLLRAQHPGQNVIVQPHGVATAVFQTDHRETARAAFPAIVGRDVLLTVARIDPVKNQLWLVRQLPAILAANPRVLLVLAGAATHPTYAVELRAEIEKLGVGHSVLLTGGLPPGDPRIIGLLQEAKVSVLPSVSETFGLVILEAWAAGGAVLASATSGACGLIREDENGFLFQLDNPADFRAKLHRLLAEPALRQRVADAGARTAGGYDVAVLAGRVRDLYARLAEEKYALRNSA